MVLGLSYLIFSVALLFFGFAGVFWTFIYFIKYVVKKTVTESYVDLIAYGVIATINWAQTMWRSYGLRDSAVGGMEKTIVSLSFPPLFN